MLASVLKCAKGNSGIIKQGYTQMSMSALTNALYVKRTHADAMLSVVMLLHAAPRNFDALCYPAEPSVLMRSYQTCKPAMMFASAMANWAACVPDVAWASHLLNSDAGFPPSLLVDDGQADFAARVHTACAVRGRESCVAQPDVLSKCTR